MITSASNEQVKNVVRLQKSAKDRKEQDCFVAEGIRMVREVPPERVLAAYVSESLMEKGEYAPLCERLHAECVSDRVMRQMSDTETPQGILAVVRRREASAEALCSASDALLLVLEHIQDPGNLGTIVRTAEGAGVTGLLLSFDTVDIYNPKVVRATMGSIFRVPFAFTADLPQTLQKMRSCGIRVFAAHLAGSRLYDEEDYTGPCAFLIGNEGAGLTEAAAAQSDMRVRIPMAGQVESLNAAVSCALLAYEAARQRRKRTI